MLYLHTIPCTPSNMGELIEYRVLDLISHLGFPSPPSLPLLATSFLLHVRRAFLFFSFLHGGVNVDFNIDNFGIIVKNSIPLITEITRMMTNRPTDQTITL